jgi:hypothetical protein
MKQGNQTINPQASNIWGNLAKPLPGMNESEWMESAEKYLNKTMNPHAFAAITAKYIGETETRGSRIKVTSQRGSKTYPYPHEFSRDEVFSHCVAKYLESVRDEDRKIFGQASHDGWGNLSDYAMGVLPSGEHVFVSVR